MNTNEIVTRFAPSPTGYMHIGNLRTALYSYLIAKHDGGKFILRIEDTDRERLVEGATDVIIKTLEMTGIEYDEGPFVGGEHGPYVQSERKPIYMEYAKKLIESGHAYYLPLWNIIPVISIDLGVKQSLIILETPLIEQIMDL